MFFTRVNRPRAIPSPVGDGIEPVFEERIVNGVRSLVRTGGNPINAFVQESLRDTLVYNILDRYQRGDVNALQRMSGQFMDVTGMPKNLAEAQQKLIDVERQFSLLPISVRQRFDNSMSKFVAGFADGSALEILKDAGFITAPPRQSVEEVAKQKEVGVKE